MGALQIVSLILKLLPMAGKLFGTGIEPGEGTAQTALQTASAQHDDRDYRGDAQAIIKDAQADLLQTHDQSSNPVDVSDKRLKHTYGMSEEQVNNFISFLQQKEGNAALTDKENMPELSDRQLQDAVVEFLGTDQALDVMDDTIRPGNEPGTVAENNSSRPEEENIWDDIDFDTVTPQAMPSTPAASAILSASGTAPFTPAASAMSTKKGTSKIGSSTNTKKGTSKIGSSTNTKSGGSKNQNPPPPPDDTLSTINSAMDKAGQLRFFGNLAATLLSMDAGGFGNQENFGQGLKPVARFIQDSSNLGYAERKGAITRQAEDKLMLELVAELRAIDTDPTLSGPQKLYYKEKAKENMHSRIRRMQYTMNLGAPVGQGIARVSDINEKQIKPCARTALMLMRSGLELSDDDYKIFKDIEPEEMAMAINEAGPPYRGHELEFLHDFTADREGGEYIKPIQYAGIWSPEVLQGYAMWIKNAHYNYKPEAQALDPSIDPETEHIGPMAQEIEKVIPAAVQEVQGVKTVDTSRLALANAGAIADLARQNIMQGKAIEQLASTLKGVA